MTRAEYIAQALAAAPALSDEQKCKLETLLEPVRSNGGTGSAIGET